MDAKKCVNIEFLSESAVSREIVFAHISHLFSTVFISCIKAVSGNDGRDDRMLRIIFYPGKMLY